ncbi:enoyl-CoA hydratase/isomerase family protein [Bradyrhizobium tropiciagri]|uniref:enoyl-CoA hydratase/isomerase family protein n=1 Tax=Bradyrhizobium tropiciagri TaxID=312253 RepID=UPI00067E01FE
MIAAVEKPVIAAINWLCMGGGFEFALACDLRVAGNAVTAIGLPETRIDSFPGNGATQRLPTIIGTAKTLEIILRGLTLTGPRAHEIGIVHEVVAGPVARALRWCKDIEPRCRGPGIGQKALPGAALNRPMADGLTDERRSLRMASAREGGRPLAGSNAEALMPTESWSQVSVRAPLDAQTHDVSHRERSSAALRRPLREPEGSRADSILIC